MIAFTLKIAIESKIKITAEIEIKIVKKKFLKIVIKSSSIITMTVQISVSEIVVVEIKTKSINENENFIINYFRILSPKKISESYSKNEDECSRSIENFFQFIRNRLKQIEIKIENENVFEIEKIFEKKKTFAIAIE